MTVTSNLPFVADMNHDGRPDTPIESVVPLGSQFQVNSVTTNWQVSPSVGMDENGDFTIAWASQGQGMSFFNVIEAQRFDRDGNRLGSEFMVNDTDLTDVSFMPDVAMSNDGTIAITWSETNDTAFLLYGEYTIGVLAKVYDSQGNVLLSQFEVGGGGCWNYNGWYDSAEFGWSPLENVKLQVRYTTVESSTVAFDANDDFTVSWQVLTSNDNIQGGASSYDVFAQEYQVYDSTGAVSGAVLRPTFRVSSATSDLTQKNFWPDSQSEAHVAMDADGDMTFSYDGFGPAASDVNVDQTEIDSLVMAVTYAQETLGFTYSDIYGGKIEWGNVLPANYQSYFRLYLPGVGTTGDILFDITSAATLNTTATAIQSALQSLTGDAGLTVAYMGGSPVESTSYYQFLVTFSSTTTAYSRPAMQMLGPAVTGHPATTAALVSTFTNPNYAALGLDRQEWEAYVGLLRGDANAAMFSQFDADPTLNTQTGTTTTVVSSDDIANAQRDGQDATYYMDLDPYAVSGSFDVDLTVYDDAGNANKVTLTIQPAFYASGPVDPDATLKVIDDTLEAAANVGINWPEDAHYGPVNVQLVNNPFNPTDKNLSGDFNEELGSPWDPSAHGINSTFYVYQITFQGETHDTPILLKWSDDLHCDLARRPVPKRLKRSLPSAPLVARAG